MSARFVWADGERARVVELSPEGGGGYRVSVDGVAMDVEAVRLADGRLRLTTAGRVTVAEITAVGDRRFVRVGTLDFILDRDREARVRGRAAHGGGLESPMPGVVTRVLVAPGDHVRKGQPLLALEAMKMEHVIRAPRAGTVASVAAKAGALVDGGTPLVELADGGEV